MRCIPRGIQVWHHLSEAEIQANRVYSTSPSEDPPKPQSQSIGAMKKKKVPTLLFIMVPMVQEFQCVVSNLLLMVGKYPCENVNYTYTILQGTNCKYIALI